MMLTALHCHRWAPRLQRALCPQAVFCVRTLFSVLGAQWRPAEWQRQVVRLSQTGSGDQGRGLQQGRTLVAWGVGAGAQQRTTRQHM